MTEKPKPQIDKFKEAAREAETDDREEAFDRALKSVATTKLPSPKKRKGPALKAAGA